MKAEKYSQSVATNMVIANMIGTGIFTAIGYQVMADAIPDPFTILIIWGVGGLFSLCGAFAYSEVASSVNRSGGEYSFLSELYHPLLGFFKWLDFNNRWVFGFNCSPSTGYRGIFSSFNRIIKNLCDFFVGYRNTHSKNCLP